MENNRSNIRKKCHYVIHAASAATALIGAYKLPFSDMASITAVQATMIISLAVIFKVEITTDAAEEIARTYVVGTMGKLIAGGLSKLVPVVGNGVNAAVAAALTEVLGWEVAEQFAVQTDTVF